MISSYISESGFGYFWWERWSHSRYLKNNSSTYNRWIILLWDVLGRRKFYVPVCVCKLRKFAPWNLFANCYDLVRNGPRFLIISYGHNGAISYRGYSLAPKFRYWIYSEQNMLSLCTHLNLDSTRKLRSICIHNSTISISAFQCLCTSN